MPRQMTTLTLTDAKVMIAAAERKAEGFGMPYNVAVVDAGGHLIAFARQDGGLIGSIDLAINKAVSARLFDKTTDDLSEMGGPEGALFGIAHSNHGHVVIFGGGIPVVVDGEVIGAVGASAGTIDQDITVAMAAIEALVATFPSMKCPGGPAPGSGQRA